MNYKVKLEMFEGPLDLLLCLIKEEELNIYDIPITRITGQYLEYLDFMQTLDLDVAGDFLVMASTLMLIKSRMLLPEDPEGVETQEEDLRAELVARLLEYKSFKEASGQLKAFEIKRSSIFSRLGVEPESLDSDSSFVEISLPELLSAFAKVLRSLPKNIFHEITQDEFSVAEKVQELLECLVQAPKVYFSALFRSARSKQEVIAIFLALLELVRLREVVVRQENHFGEIEITLNYEKVS